MVFFLAGFQQFYWRSRGGRNDVFSAVLLMAILAGAIAFLGWWALLTVALGMIVGPLLARPQIRTPDIEPTAHVAPTAKSSPARNEDELPRQPTLADFASAGDAEAQYVVGCNLLNDTSHRNDGIQLLRKSSAQGFVHAQFELGRVLLGRAETESEIMEVVSLLSNAAENGQGKAALFLSKIFDQGLGVEKNPDKAREWFAKVPHSQRSSAEHEFTILMMNRDFYRSYVRMKRDKT